MTVVANELTAQCEDDTEAQLVERAKQRWPSAWAEIYDAHYRKLYRYCYVRTGSDAIAADLASKVYLNALEGIDRYQYRGRPLLAWLYRIAHNVVVDHLRAHQRETKALERASSLREPHDPGPASQVAEREDLRAALQHLTEEQRQVVVLRYYADLTTREIAHTLERTERAVYSLEVRALAALRRVLEPEQLPGTKREAA